MNQVSPLLRRGEGRWFHWCPACEQTHPLPDSWTFNGNEHAPTWSPSFKQTFYKERGEYAGRNVVCHYIITDGKIQFCPDSWHKRSDIVAMPPIPEHLADPADDGFQPSGIETQD